MHLSYKLLDARLTPSGPTNRGTKTQEAHFHFSHSLGFLLTPEAQVKPIWMSPEVCARLPVSVPLVSVPLTRSPAALPPWWPGLRLHHLDPSA